MWETDTILLRTIGIQSRYMKLQKFFMQETLIQFRQRVFRHGSRPYLISYNGKNEVIERIKNYTENNPGK